VRLRELPLRVLVTGVLLGPAIAAVAFREWSERRLRERLRRNVKWVYRP
jgi:hypothetical protein